MIIYMEVVCMVQKLEQVKEEIWDPHLHQVQEPMIMVIGMKRVA